MKGGRNIEIKLIGSSCSNGIKLKKELKKAARSKKTTIEIQECNDEKSKAKYHVQNIPALVVDNEVKSEGRVLSERELCKLLFEGA